MAEEREQSSAEDEMNFEDIRSDKGGLNFLVLIQLNRINYLLTNGIFHSTSDSKSVFRGVKYGLWSVECMLKSTIDKDRYEEDVKELKKVILDESIASVALIDKCLEWYNLLMDYLPKGLKPLKHKEFVVK